MPRKNLKSLPQRNLPGIGVVVIGRNEGERLKRCIASVLRDTRVVYVDSGSTDGSADLARAMGVDTIELDTSKPLSAARARNEGFRRLAETLPQTRFIQFVDGDCELFDGWLERGAGELNARDDVAVVCGHVRERHPTGSVYNRLFEMELDLELGEVDSCGGVFMVRTEAFTQAGGFNSVVVASEDRELCIRFRRSGWKIIHLDANMVWHDAEMTRFTQWWKRGIRSGHAYAQGAHLHGGSRFRHFVRESRSTWFWGFMLPLLVAAAAWPTNGLSLLLLGGYVVLGYRVFGHMRTRGRPASDARLWAVHCVAAKFPEMLGQTKYWLDRLLNKPPTIIEWKEAHQVPAERDRCVPDGCHTGEVLSGASAGSRLREAPGTEVNHG